jgi:SAM-dependent methyltransferase
MTQLPVAATEPQELNEITCCPRCHAELLPGRDQWHCSAPTCIYAKAGFPVMSGQPVLVDFERSIFLRSHYDRAADSVLPRDDSGRSLRTRLRRALMGANPVASRMSQMLLRLLHERAERPMILVVGGGAVGAGMAALYDDPRVRIIGTDLYASANTRVVADGHALPFRDGMFDAVVIQAVLEHVLMPQRVVDEIHRVLRPDGLVYAETPFLWPVHEAAFDFTRFTCSGHRWLFRHFTEIQAGTVGGAGEVAVLSIHYLMRALGANSKVAMVATIPFAWLRLLDRFGRPRQTADAATGHYFLGQRSAAQALHETDMVAYYESQLELTSPGR